MSIVAPVPTSVYRYYDKTGLLLYVGITSRGITRQREHNSTKEWWPYVSRQEVDHFPTRNAALDHERHTIRRFRPPFNKQHNPGHEAIRELYLASGLGGNRAMRGGTRRPTLTSRSARSVYGSCKGRVALALEEYAEPWVVYGSPPEAAALVTEAIFPTPVLLLNPTKVAVFDHREVGDGVVRLVFKQTGGSGRPPIRAELHIKARQPFALFAHQVRGEGA